MAKNQSRHRSATAPGALLIEAVWAALRRRVAYELSGSVLRAGRLDRSRGPALIATPRDFRPTDPASGRAMLAGRFVLAGAELSLGPGGDPWDHASPSRRFATALHSFEWLPDLLACGDAGAREALRLFLDWRRQFYRPNRFVWSADILERRVFNLACGAKRMGAVASDVEAAHLFKAMLHQGRYLIRLNEGPSRLAERSVVAAIAASVLNGKKAQRLAALCLTRSSKALPATVLADGGMRSRSPEAGLELLFDLLTLDDVLLQRGREAPSAVSRAIDRLGAGLRFFTLADGRTAAFHGGEAADPERVRAATSHEAEEGDAAVSGQAPHSGYHRLDGPTVQAIIDGARPAAAAWGLAACAQPLALEVVCGPDRIFANGGWSPKAAGSPAFRMTAAANTAEIGGRSSGRLLKGFFARTLGPRLVDGQGEVATRREESEAGVWLELAHDGWATDHGVSHTRRLYIDKEADELRGEDGFSAVGRKRSRRLTPFSIRFHAHPEVQVSLARDGRSVLLRGPSDRGWWFRNDAPEVVIEPSVVFDRGQPRRTVQLVLRGEIDVEGSARVRWKLTPIEPPPTSRPKLKSKAALAAAQGSLT